MPGTTLEMYCEELRKIDKYNYINTSIADVYRNYPFYPGYDIRSVVCIGTAYYDGIMIPCFSQQVNIEIKIAIGRFVQERFRTFDDKQYRSILENIANNFIMKLYEKNELTYRNGEICFFVKEHPSLGNSINFPTYINF